MSNVRIRFEIMHDPVWQIVCNAFIPALLLMEDVVVVVLLAVGPLATLGWSISVMRT